MTNLATWLRATLDDLAEGHRRMILAEGQNPDHEREADPDGVWALLDAHRRILDEVVPRINAMDDRIEREWGTSDVGAHEDSELLIRLLASAYQHADGYRDEWRPQ